jgi:hypothetical protein
LESITKGKRGKLKHYRLITWQVEAIKGIRIANDNFGKKVIVMQNWILMEYQCDGLAFEK